MFACEMGFCSPFSSPAQHPTQPKRSPLTGSLLVEILQSHRLTGEKRIVYGIASGQTWFWCKYYGAPVRQMVMSLRVLVSWMFVDRLGEADSTIWAKPVPLVADG